MHRHRLLALAVAAGLAAAGSPAAAQTPETPTPPPVADSARRTMDPIGRLLEQREQLALTEDQVRELEAIRAKYRAKHEGHMEQMRRHREARAAFRASMDSARAEVAAVLTPEQEQQVEAMRKERRRHRHNRWHDG